MSTLDTGATPPLCLITATGAFAYPFSHLHITCQVVA
jgi:hypothetical protein